MGLFGPQGISHLALQVFLALVTFFVSPGDFRSHSTGLFSLCNVFHTPWDLRHFTGLFGLGNVFVPPQDCTL